MPFFRRRRFAPGFRQRYGARRGTFSSGRFGSRFSSRFRAGLGYGAGRRGFGGFRPRGARRFMRDSAAETGPSDHGGEVHKYVIDNPSVYGYPSLAASDPNSCPCTLVEWDRLEKLTYTPYAATQLGFKIHSFRGLESVEESTANVSPWELNFGTLIGDDATAVLSYDGIAVGDGGTKQFNFAFNTALLPSEFFEKTQFFRFLQFKGITCEIIPRAHGLTPWSAVPTVVQTTDVPASVAHVDLTPGISNADQGQAAHMNVAMVKVEIPRSFAWAGAHYAAGMWNTLGLSDTTRAMTPCELAIKSGHARRVDPRVRHRFFKPDVLVAKVKQVLPFVLTGENPEPSSDVTSDVRFLQDKFEKAGRIAIPQGGFRNPGMASGPTGSEKMPLFTTPLGALLIDTNNSPFQYSGRPDAPYPHDPVPPRGSYGYQDFTVQAQPSNGVKLLNPPLQWQVRYIVEVEFSGQPITGNANLALY